MADSLAPVPLQIGFLTVQTEPTGQLGGYLVTNGWGRPLEFRLSTAVQPNRIQQILYGPTLQAYICADLIARTLYEKTGTQVRLVLTDRRDILDLRLHVPVPVLWLAGQNDPQSARPDTGAVVLPRKDGALLCHPCFPNDASAIRGLLGRLVETLDLAEPFGRIRQAIAEARKLGVTSKN